MGHQGLRDIFLVVKATYLKEWKSKRKVLIIQVKCVGAMELILIISSMKNNLKKGTEYISAILEIAMCSWFSNPTIPLPRVMNVIK